MSELQRHVQQYFDENFGRPHPIPTKEKGPRISEWQDETKRFALDEFSENVGTLLVGGLCDLDLDSLEAIDAAPSLLLQTNRVHGRPSKRASHYWYRVAGEIASFQFKDTDGTVILEIRAGSSHQTLLPPSVHPSGEMLEWDLDDEIGRVEAAALKKSAALVATCALLAKHWPAGSRHVAARDAAGFLASREIEPLLIETVIGLAAQIAGDNEVADRKRVARDSVEQFKSGGKTTGLPSLIAVLGDAVVQRLRDWFDGDDPKRGVVDELNERHFVVSVGKDVVYGHVLRDGDVVFRDRKAMSNLYENQLVQVGTKGKEPIYRTAFEIWRQSTRRRDHDNAVFAPPGALQPAHVRDFNLYRGVQIDPSVEYPRQPARVARFIEHTHDVICNGNAADFDYLKAVLNNLIRYPGRPGEVATTLRSERQGTGKGDAFVEVIGSLFDPHMLTIANTERLTGKFNGHLQGLIVLFADEAIWSDQKAVRGTLKTLITAKRLPIERKGLDIVYQPSFLHLFAATNYEHSAPKEFADRRWFTLHVSERYGKGQPGRRDYFETLFAEIAEPGFRDALIAEILSWGDVKRLNDPPNSLEAENQSDLTSEAESRWFKECLLNGEIFGGEGWPEWIPSSDLHLAFLLWCDKKRIEGERASEIELVKRLRSFMGEGKRRYAGRRDPRTGTPIPSNEQVQQRGRTLPALAKCREAFDAKAGTVTLWPDASLLDLAS